MNIPIGHNVIMPYLMVKDAQAFIEFMGTVFDAVLTFTKWQEDDATAIKHAELQINGATIMFCDATDRWQPQTANMFIYVPNADATYDKATQAGATSVMPPSDQNYGRSCGVTDPFGNTWWVTSIQ